MDALRPGWTLVDGEHWWKIYFAGQTAHLPKGKHGAWNPELEIGQVKTRFRQFDKLDEARKRIPQLP